MANGADRRMSSMVLLLGVVVLGALMGFARWRQHLRPASGRSDRKARRPPCAGREFPCSGPAGGVTVVTMRSGTRVATNTTTEAGTYRFVLRPGTYVVRTLRSSIRGQLRCADGARNEGAI